MPPRTRRRIVAVLPLAVALLLSAGRSLAATPADPGWAQQWAPAKIGAPTAWDTSRGTGITIGVVDTGVALAHEDLASKVVAATTCQATDGNPAACRGTGQDDEGHGTHVAGIAAAVTDNGRGIAGMAPDAKIVVAKSVFRQPSGPPRTTVGDLNAGIRWVVDRGAKVVNLSVGGNILITATPGASLRDGIDYAWKEKGAVVVLAAGNAAALGFPNGDYGDVPAIVVAATGPDDEVSAQSSPTGTARWAVAAPGGNSNNSNPKHAEENQRLVLSTFLENYALDEGTGVAAPHVAGTVALVLSRPGVTAQKAVDLVLQTAVRTVSCGGGSLHCAGRVDAAAAVAATRAGNATTTTTVTTTSTTAPAERTTTTTGPPESSSTTMVLAPPPSTTTPDISVPRPPERPTTTTTVGEIATGGGGGGDGGLGGLAVVGALALAASGAWAALVARREGLPELATLPFLGPAATELGADDHDGPGPTGGAGR